MPKLILVNPLYPEELQHYEGSAVIIIVDQNGKAGRVCFMDRLKSANWIETNANQYPNKTILLGLVSIVGEVFAAPESMEPNMQKTKLVN